MRTNKVSKNFNLMIEAEITRLVKDSMRATKEDKEHAIEIREVILS